MTSPIRLATAGDPAEPRRRRPDGPATARSSSARHPGGRIWYFADRTLGLELPTRRDQLWPCVIALAWLIVRRTADRHADWSRATGRPSTGPGWPTGVGRSPRSTPRSGRSRDRSGGRASPLAGGPRAALPRASAVAGPGRRGRLRAATSTTTRRSGSRSRRAGTAADPARSRSSSPTAARTRLSFSRLGRVELPFADGPRSLVGLLDGRLRRRPVHPVPRRHERAPRRTAPGATSSTPPRAPTSAATRPPAR